MQYTEQLVRQKYFQLSIIAKQSKLAYISAILESVTSIKQMSSYQGIYNIFNATYSRFFTRYKIKFIPLFLRGQYSM